MYGNMYIEVEDTQHVLAEENTFEPNSLYTIIAEIVDGEDIYLINNHHLIAVKDCYQMEIGVNTSDFDLTEPIVYELNQVIVPD
jgi:hypothetical protein